MPPGGNSEGAMKGHETKRRNKEEVNKLIKDHEELKKLNEQLRGQLQEIQHSQAAMANDVEAEIQRRVADEVQRRVEDEIQHRLQAREAELRDELAHEETYQSMMQSLTDQNDGDHHDDNRSTTGSIDHMNTGVEAEYSGRWFSSLDDIPMQEHLYHINKRMLDYEFETVYIHQCFKDSEHMLKHSTEAFHQAKIQHKVLHMKRQALPKYGAGLRDRLLETLHRIEKEKEGSPEASSVTVGRVLDPFTGGSPTSLEGDSIMLDTNPSSDPNRETKITTQPQALQKLPKPGQKRKYHAC